MKEMDPEHPKTTIGAVFDNGDAVARLWVRLIPSNWSAILPSSRFER